MAGLLQPLFAGSLNGSGAVAASVTLSDGDALRGGFTLQYAKRTTPVNKVSRAHERGKCKSNE